MVESGSFRGEDVFSFEMMQPVRTQFISKHNLVVLHIFWCNNDVSLCILGGSNGHEAFYHMVNYAVKPKDPLENPAANFMAVMDSCIVREELFAKMIGRPLTDKEKAQFRKRQVASALHR